MKEFTVCGRAPDCNHLVAFCDHLDFSAVYFRPSHHGILLSNADYFSRRQRLVCAMTAVTQYTMEMRGETDVSCFRMGTA